MATLASPRRPARRDRSAWHVVGFFVGLPVLVCAMLWATLALTATSRVKNRLTEFNQGHAVMVCDDGYIDAAGSWWNALTGGGALRCTAWSLRRGQGDVPAGMVEWPTSPRR